MLYFSSDSVKEKNRVGEGEEDMEKINYFVTSDGQESLH